MFIMMMMILCSRKKKNPMIDRSTYRLDLVLSIQRYLSDPLRGNVLMLKPKLTLTFR